jgi:hypothetical protein
VPVGDFRSDVDERERFQLRERQAAGGQRAASEHLFVSFAVEQNALVPRRTRKYARELRQPHRTRLPIGVMNVRTVIAVADVTACQAIAVHFGPKALGPKNVRRTSARMSRMKMTLPKSRTRKPKPLRL